MTLWQDVLYGLVAVSAVGVILLVLWAWLTDKQPRSDD